MNLKGDLIRSLSLSLQKANHARNSDGISKFIGVLPTKQNMGFQQPPRPGSKFFSVVSTKCPGLKTSLNDTTWLQLPRPNWELFSRSAKPDGFTWRVGWRSNRKKLGLENVGKSTVTTTTTTTTTYNIQHTTYNKQQTTNNIQHTTYNIQHPTSNIQHTT